MAAARHASRGDEKRGDQAALSPLLLIVVAVGKRVGAVRRRGEPSVMALNFIGCGAPG